MALRVRVIKAGVFLVYPLGRDRGFRALEFRRRNSKTKMDYRHSGHHSSRQISVDSPVCARPQPLAHENSSQQSLNAYSPRPEQESQAYQYHDLDSVFFFQRQQQRQQNPALDTTYLGAGVHSETLQIDLGWDTVGHAPLEAALHSQNDFIHLNTYTGSLGLLPADLSSSHTSDSTHSFYHHHCLSKQHALSTSNWTGMIQVPMVLILFCLL